MLNNFSIVVHAASGTTYHKNTLSDVGAISIAHGTLSAEFVEIRAALGKQGDGSFSSIFGSKRTVPLLP
jgi:hypothetical protein